MQDTEENNAIRTQVTKQVSPVRKKKLERIKNKVKSGKYKVSTMELAKALFMSQ